MKQIVCDIRLWLLIERYNIKNILRQVWSCLWLFGIVCIIMSSEVWVPYLVYFITGSQWWLGIGSACWLFWIGPGTPFIPLCIAITLGLKKIFGIKG